MPKAWPKVESLKEEGNRYFKNEDFPKAIKCYRVGLEMEPTNPTLNCNLSQAYLGVGEHSEAEVHAVVTLARRNDSVKGYYRAAKAAYGLKKRDRALMYLKYGLANCPQADELKSLMEEINEANDNPEPQETREIGIINNVATNEINTLQKNDVTTGNSEDTKNKTRSRSTSNNRSSNKGPKIVSTSSSTNKPSANTKNDTCTKHVKDKFIETLLKIKDGLLPEEKDALARKKEAHIQLQQKLQDFMKEGSEALMSGLARQASEKYKVALDILAEGNLGDFDLLEIDFIVLKYSLSISWLQTLDYNYIVQSVTYLTDLEVNHAAKLPAVYFGLGSAFYRLNRFKTALQHLDKGMQIIDKNFKITSHPWPGTLKTITETTKDGLEESINKLVLECKPYRIPDAICRYNNCITESVHISPSRIIFYSDPDFAGYVVIICQENCRITYHIGCWKHYKDSISPVGKLSDKEMLGHVCLTSDCLSEGDLQSLIVCIEVYGEDGKIKTSCIREPSKTDNVNELRMEKKKRNEKAEKIVKVKPNRPRARRIIPQGVIKKGKSRSMTREFLACLQILVDMRSLNFGFDESLLWNPTKDYFGRKDVEDMQTYLKNNADESESLKQTKDFIFTFFYEYLNDEGPKKFSVVERKWSEEVSQFPGIDFISKHDGICDFLLQSYRFASIDDNLCLANQIASVYDEVYIEMEQSASFILSCSSRSVQDDLDVNKCLNEDSEDDFEPDIPVLPSTEEHNFPSTSYAQCLRSNSSSLTSFSHSSLDKQCNEIHSNSPVPGYNNIAYASDSSDGNYDEMEKSDSEDGDDEEDDDSNRENSDDIIMPKSIGNPCEENVEKEMPELEEELCSNSSEIYIQKSNSPPPLLSELSKPTAIDHLLPNLMPEKATNPTLTELKSTIYTSFGVQTEPPQDLEKTIDELQKENMRLKLQNRIATDDKRNIMSDFQKKIDDYQIQIQDLEVKLSRVIAEKEKASSNYQVEINKRDSKYDQMIKKNKEQTDLLIKKREEDSSLLKKTLESMTELAKEDEKKSSIINRMEVQLRKANEQTLNLRKTIGECKLDHYITKCKERLDFMNFMMKYMQHLSFSKISEMKNSIDAWQTVFRELQDTRDLLQIQYDILAQQLKTKASSDCLLQLELADLPVEPLYPLEDYDYIILLVTTYLQNNNVEEQRSLFNNSDMSLTNPIAKTIHQPLSKVFTETSNATSYLPAPGTSFFSDPPPPSMIHQFRHPNINETANGNIGSTWNNSLSEPSSLKETSSLGVGTNSSSSSTISIPDNQFRLFEPQSNELNSAANSEVCSSVKLASEMKKLGAVGSDFNTNLVPMEEKKSSSVSGLIPIEISKPTPSDIKESNNSFKAVYSDLRSGTQSRKVWNYSRLLEELLINFKRKSEAELSECLAIVRERNGNKLSGLTVPSIIKRVERVLEEKCMKNSGSMGMDKFGGAAWGEVKEKNVNWINDELDNECIICHMTMEANSVTSLQCKHTFHTECVRKWLHTSSTCPICRKYTCLADEFPPLS